MEKGFILPPTPSLKSDLFERILLEMDRYPYQQNNTFSVVFRYRETDTGISYHQLGTWYAEMMYIADRQPTLAQSTRFKNEIKERVYSVVRAFMEEYCKTHQTMEIEVDYLQLAQGRMEFYWRPKGFFLKK